jgi:hypothetical protein
VTLGGVPQIAVGAQRPLSAADAFMVDEAQRRFANRFQVARLGPQVGAFAAARVGAMSMRRMFPMSGLPGRVPGMACRVVGTATAVAGFVVPRMTVSGVVTVVRMPVLAAPPAMGARHFVARAVMMAVGCMAMGCARGDMRVRTRGDGEDDH